MPKALSSPACVCVFENKMSVVRIGRERGVLTFSARRLYRVENLTFTVRMGISLSLGSLKTLFIARFNTPE